MIRNELQRSALNCEMPFVLATGLDGKKLWMRVNPALGTMTFAVIKNGKNLVETLSLERAMDAYNDLKKEAAA
jgi:hypothetical protein